MEMSGTTCTRSLRNLRQKDAPNCIIVQLRRSLVFKQKELKHQNRKQTSTTSSISHLFVQRFSAAQRKATP